MADWIPLDLDSLVERDRKIKELEERVAALENRLNTAGEIEPRVLKKQCFPQATSAEIVKRILRGSL